MFFLNILKSKAHDKSIQARKKLFWLVIVKSYLCNVLCKFLIKFESMWRHEMKEQLYLTVLYSVVGLSEAATGGFLYKKLFLKSHNIHRKHPCWSSQRMCFPVTIAKFLRLLRKTLGMAPFLQFEWFTVTWS